MRRHLFRLRRLHAVTLDAAANPTAALGDDAIDLEDLGVVAVDVRPVDARDVPDVVGVRVAAVLLRRVALHRRDLALDVALLERDVGAIRELVVVPGNLVTQERRALERTQSLLCDGLVILVDVVVRGLEDDIGTPVLPQGDEKLEDVLPTFRKRPDVEVVHGQLRLGDAELRGRLPDLARVSDGNPAGSDRVAIEKAT